MTKAALLAGLSLLAAAPAYAFPPAGTPQKTPILLTGNGQPASAAFVYADAADTSELNLVIPAFGLVFNNKTAKVGDVVDVGSPSGPVRFELRNLTNGDVFRNGTPDSDGNFHFYLTTNYGEFGVGAVPTVISDYIASLDPDTLYAFVGAEDRAASDPTGSDFDYNDIIYLFTQQPAQNEDVPAPASVALFGLGMVAFGLVRRRRG